MGEKGAYINESICPHHPDKIAERIEYKINCECRKPNQECCYRRYKILILILSSSWMVGDGETDIMQASAGCKTILIGNEEFGHVSVNSLKEFVDRYLE